MIPKVIAPLLAPVYFLCGCILIIWASRLKPHSLALKKFGIRVVAPKDYGSQDNHGEAYSALALLKRFDEERMELVEKHIRIIFLFGGTRGVTGYVRTGRVCLLNLQKFPECPAGTMPIAIAGILVYFASLAKFKIKVPFVGGREDIKNICEEEQQQTVEKLSKILCE
jgi:hypothetical protein